MARMRRLILNLASLAAIAATGSCGQNTSPTVNIDVIGDSADPFQGGARLGLGGQLVRAATTDGLVAFDEQGRVIPALADRWIVADDGMSYIFRLRDGNWSDGSQLSGEAVRDSLRAALDSLRGTALGKDLSVISEVRAMTGRVVEIRLARATPDLLDLLAQPEMGLLHKGKGSGAFLLQRDGKAALLRPLPPEKRATAADSDRLGTIQPLRLSALPADGAAARFRDGLTSAVLGGTAADYAQALAVTDISRRSFRIDPVAGLYGLVVTGANGALATPEMREALAMAIDREALGTDLQIREWVPSNRLLPSSLSDAPPTISERWASMDMAQRRSEAASRLARLHKKGTVPPVLRPVLRIALPTGPGADILFARIKSDFAAVGIGTERTAWNAAADLRLVDAAARFARAAWYFNQFSCEAGRNPCSINADNKAAAASAEPDPAKRAGLLEDAEAALTLANIYIPLGNPIRWSLLRGGHSGFAANPRGWHPLGPLAQSPK